MFKSGKGRGIRTLGPFTVWGFSRRCLKPLGAHPRSELSDFDDFNLTYTFYSLLKSIRSAFIVAASVTAIPQGKPGYEISFHFLKVLQPLLQKGEIELFDHLRHA